MSGKIQKSQIRTVGRFPGDAQLAYVNAKNSIRTGIKPAGFGNTRGRYEGDGPPLPKPSNGCEYWKYPVGQARAGDTAGSAGVKRLVLLVNPKSRQVLEAYYTDEHYQKGTMLRLHNS